MNRAIKLTGKRLGGENEVNLHFGSGSRASGMDFEAAGDVGRVEEGDGAGEESGEGGRGARAAQVSVEGGAERALG